MTSEQYRRLKKYLRQEKKQPDSVRHIIHLLEAIHKGLQDKEKREGRA